MSRIGKKPLAIPAGVKIEIKDRCVIVEGPKGQLSRVLPDRINVEIKDNVLFVTRKADTKLDKSLHGLCRALISNMIVGVIESYVKQLEIVGVGFKAQIQDNSLIMQLGFSHPVNFHIPEGITIEVPKTTQIVVKGIDKELVGKIAHEIRMVRPPEPYKGKGIRFAGEYVKKKIGKAQATASK